MTVQLRPTPLRPSFDKLLDLDAWLVQRLRNIEGDLGDDEFLQHAGSGAQSRLLGQRAAFSDVRWVIREAVEREVAEQSDATHEDAVEAAYKEAYGSGPLAPWQAEGR